jgi:signal transduction histidine kinase
MRRVSARLIIAAPWLLTLAAVALAARIGWTAAVLSAIAGAVIATITASAASRSLRTLAKNIRAGRRGAGSASTIGEFDAIRSAAEAASQAGITRADAAAQAEEGLLAVIASVTEGILQITSNGRLVHVNPAARELLNLPDNVAGQAAGAVIRNSELRTCIEDAARGVSYDPVEIVVDDRNLLVSPRPLRVQRGDQPAGAVIAIVDLTQFRRLESVRRDFVANVSHELKTPLTSIRGYAETLLGDDVPPEMQKQFIQVIHNNAERIQHIVDDLLDLSRLQSGGWEPELQDVDALAVAEDVWATCAAAHRKQLGFSALAQGDRDVLADPAGLRHVLSNLFDNAIRYTSEGGNVAVVIRNASGTGNGVTSQPHYIELIVSDTGSGIPRESLPRIFERFYRVDPSRSRQEGGTGLGLSIVKHLVERMSGEVSAESELGKGTTIRIKLPAAHEH